MPEPGCLFLNIRLLVFCFFKKRLSGEGKDNQIPHGFLIVIQQINMHP